VLTLRERVGEAFHAQYLALSSGNDAVAQAAHRLDVELRDALRPELEFIEVAMRSRYHDTMIECRPGRPVWLLDPSLPVRGILHRNAGAELVRLEAGVQSPGQTVNHVSFSFWRQLTARGFEKVLWVPYLHRAYGARADRREVHAAVEDIVRLRKRVHHYQEVLTLPLRQHWERMLWLLNRLMPELGEERRFCSRLPALLDYAAAQRPVDATH
jgi:hypothetical protein